MKSENEIKIVVLGDAKVGKTVLLKRYISNYFDSYYYNTYCK